MTDDTHDYTKTMGLFERRPSGRTIRAERLAWTERQLDLLCELYPTHTAAELVRVIGRSVSAIQTRAAQLELKKVGRGGRPRK